MRKDKGEEGKRKRMRKGRRNRNYDSSKNSGIQVPGWGAVVQAICKHR